MEPIRRALLSVTDKSGLVEFGDSWPSAAWKSCDRRHRQNAAGQRRSRDGGVGFHRLPGNAGRPAQDPAPQDSRGILGRRTWIPPRADGQPEHKPIDLVLVNFYQFEKAVAHPGCTLADAIENIDIGGPTLFGRGQN